MKPPVFILGCPRSGTTLLARLLAYTSYGSPVETHFITKYYKKLETYGSLRHKDGFQRLVRDILGERPVMQWKLSIDVEDLYARMERFDYPELVDKICMARAERQGSQSWGDKTPNYLLDLDIIHTLYPDSKFIYIVRDGRDVALSLLAREWGPNNVYSCARYWKECNRDHPALQALQASGRLYALRYEDLLTQADRIVPELYAFLDEHVDAADVAHLLPEIRTTNSHKWKTAMKRSDIELFETVAARTLEKFKYETRHEERGVSTVCHAWFTLNEAWHRGLFLLKINTIDAIKIKYFNQPPFGS